MCYKKEIKDWTFEAYLLYEETVLDSSDESLKMTCAGSMCGSWIFWIVFCSMSCSNSAK